MNVWCIVSVIAVLQFSMVHQLQQLAEKEEHEQPHVIYDLITSAILIASTRFRPQLMACIWLDNSY